MVWDNAGINGTRALFQFYFDGALALVGEAGCPVRSTLPPSRLNYFGRHIWDTVHADAVLDNLVFYDVAKTDFSDRFNEDPEGAPLLLTAAATLTLGPKADDDALALQATCTLSEESDGIDPLTEEVHLQAGTFSATIPTGSFRSTANGTFEFRGVLGGVRLQVEIAPPQGPQKKSSTFALTATATGANLTGTPVPVTLRLTIGNDSGSTTLTTVEVTAQSPPAVAGDYNQDGCVDHNDLTLLLTAMNQGATAPAFDLNGDGHVNIADTRKLVTLFTNPGGAPCQ